MNTALVVQCSWCRQVETTDGYSTASPVPWAKVSHGICPECYRIQIDDLLELGFEPEVRSPDLIVTHDPQVAAQLIEAEKQKALSAAGMVPGETPGRPHPDALSVVVEGSFPPRLPAHETPGRETFSTRGAEHGCDAHGCTDSAAVESLDRHSDRSEPFNSGESLEAFQARNVNALGHAQAQAIAKPVSGDEHRPAVDPTRQKRLGAAGAQLQGHDRDESIRQFSPEYQTTPEARLLASPEGAVNSVEATSPLTGAHAPSAPETFLLNQQCEHQRTQAGVMNPASPLNDHKIPSLVAGPKAETGLDESPTAPLKQARTPVIQQETPMGGRTSTTDAEYAEAEARQRVCQDFEHKVRVEGYTLRQAARALGKSPSWFSGYDSPYQIWKRDGLPGLLPRRASAGAKPTVFPDLPEWFIPACQCFYRRTNRTAEAGSAPEAIRRAISLPECPPHLVKALLLTLSLSHLPTFPPAHREAIHARERAGKDLLPERLMGLIPSTAPIMRAGRSPRDAWLRYIESPGSLMLTVDEDGIERFLEPGEWWTIDDGTINFVCTVPLARPGDPCWDKFGVIAGRFQFLLVVDHRSYCITGFSYTARPRSSYRAEDLLATLHTAYAEHGRPRVMVLEKGISAANAITDAMRLLGIQILRAASPHQKVVEGVFNKLWTKLSLERGQVGRYRGEEQDTNNLLESCRRGHTDPRTCFLPLAEVLRALRAAIAEHNAQMISGRYGRWVPAEYFSAGAKKNLRPMEPDSAWIFSPVIACGQDRLGLKVRSACIKTSVPLLPGFSQSFAFACPELHRWYGARVKLYFNPLAPDCRAKIVLAEEWRGIREGTLIGDGVQIDRQARYTRRLLEYGADPDIGKLAVRQNALALNRHAQAVRPDRTVADPVVETRDGREVTTISGVRQYQLRPDMVYAKPDSVPPNVEPIDRAAMLRELEEREQQNAALFG